jgi:hypothetical protein
MYNIEITPDSVSIGVKQVKRLLDPVSMESVEIDQGIHRVAVSLADHEGDRVAYEAAANALAQELIGRNVY